MIKVFTYLFRYFSESFLTGRTLVIILFLFITGIFILPGCKKDSINYVPITLTDKSGNIFISIDTASKSFDAYSATKITTGLLNGVFNDTIKSSFYLAITTDPRWDTVYHPPDTNVFPTHYIGRTINVRTNVDLTNYTSPYHFLLLGLDTRGLGGGSYGKLHIWVTVTPQ